MFSTKAKKNIAYVLFLISALCVILYIAYKKNDGYKGGRTLTSAKITAWRDANRVAGAWLSYEFYVGATKYTDETRCEGLTYTEAPALVGKWLPLIYTTNKPDNHSLLVHRNQYEQHHMQVPDSLEAVQKILDNN